MEKNWQQFRDGVEVLPELLRARGYHTRIAGKLHFIPNASPHGFEVSHCHDSMYDIYYPEEPWQSDYVSWLAEKRFDGEIECIIEKANHDEISEGPQFFLGSNWRREGEHSNDWITEKTCEFLRNTPDRPFFFFTSYFGPHHPHLSPGNWAEKYALNEITLPEEYYIGTDGKPIANNSGKNERFEGFTKDDFRRILAAYYGQIAHIDYGIGRILDTLVERNLEQDTIVVFTSDHGEHAGQFGWLTKGSMYAHSVRVPLIVSHPSIEKGVECDRVVNNLGLFSTILDWVDASGPTYQTSSRSLIPLLENPSTTAWVDETYSELGGNGAPSPSMLVRADRKLIRQRDDDGNLIHELYDTAAEPFDGENLWPDVESLQERHAVESILGGLDIWEERTRSHGPPS